MIALTDPALLATLREIAGHDRDAQYLDVSDQLHALADTGERWLVVKATQGPALVAVYADAEQATEASNAHAPSASHGPDLDVFVDRESGMAHKIPDNIDDDEVPFDEIPIEATRARIVEIDYTNYRGERSTRLIIPGRMHFGATEYHENPQWLLDAVDVQRSVNRTFALGDIHAWKAAS